ncbi:MAG TPA: hypothetical protein ENJ82_17135 [Bacteroidetes bacterium]|nr:hypothetical protein [Bacteroidota bacterium]
MRKIAKKFSKQCKAILTQAKIEYKKTGQVSTQTLESRKEAFDAITLACQKALEGMDMGKVIEKQLEIEPDYMIGLEDFTIPVLMLCGMMDGVFDPKAQEVAEFQDLTKGIYQRQLSGEYGHKEKQKSATKFMVLHAYDYASAYQAARNVKEVNPEGLAISYGGPMKSRRFITSLNFGEHTENLGELLPEPYLISMALTLGVANGVNSDVPVHILGVGSPILIALMSQQLRRSKAISIDSTATFKDAFEGRIYGSKYAFIKMKRYKLAAYSLINNVPYSSTSPFFKEFEAKYPSNWPALRAELGVTSSSHVKDVVEMIKDENALVEKYIPFMSRFRGGNDVFIDHLRVARAGHNYWILHNICRGVRSRIDDKAKLDKWAKYQVNRYQRISSGKWAKAIGKVVELVGKYEQY